MAATDLQDQVIRELRFDQRIDASKIGVTATLDGVITLAGTVPTYLEKLGAESAAKRVKSVRAVANDINVRLAGDKKQSDTDIAQRAIDSLRWRSGIPADRIKVTVSNGWVTLDGDVNYYFQKQEAEHAVNSLTGLMGVVNNVRVSSSITPKPADVEREIRAALVRRARLEANSNDVKTEGSRVILKGEVDSCNDADEAEFAAWQAPGVTDVKNDLSIAP